MKLHYEIILLLTILLFLSVKTTAQLPHDTLPSILKKANPLPGAHISDTIISLYSQQKSDSIFQMLRNKQSHGRLVNTLSDMLIRKKSSPAIQTIRSISHAIPNQQWEGKTITQINIITLNPLGTSITSPQKKSPNPIVKTLNSIHYKTQKRVIKKNLLFHIGDTLNPALINDNEQLLRHLPYVHDAAIVLSGNPHSDTVAIQIIAQDIYSLGAEINVINLNKTKLSLYENNFLGSGNRINNKITYNKNNAPSLRYTSGYYTANNIAGSFINTQLFYQYNSTQTSYGISANRNFPSIESRWAGGFTLQNIEAIYAWPGTLLSDSIQFLFQEYWAAHALSPVNRNKKQRRSRILVSGAIQHTNYLTQPKNSVNQYSTKTLSMAAISYSENNYYQSRYINKLGTTEDIPYGHLFEFIGGHETSEYSNRIYLGTSLQGADYFPRFGYLKTSFAIGSFMRNNQFEDGILNIKTWWFSPLLSWGTWYNRHLINLCIVKTLNTTQRQTIPFDQEYFKIRGVHNPPVETSKKLMLNYESRFFSPFDLLHFRFTPFAYTDIAWLATHQQSWFSKAPYLSMGTGLRIRNEDLVLETVEIRLQWTIAHQQKTPVFSFIIIGHSIFNPKNFLGGKPSLINSQ